MVGPVQMRTLYVEPDAAPGLPAQCRVIEVSGLLRELILALMDAPLDYAPDSRGAAIARLLLQELVAVERSEEHTSELQSLMRISYAVFCLKKKNTYYDTYN